MLEEEHIEQKYLLKIGENIRAIRLKKKIRQNEIAYRCNFDKSSYNNIEAGKRNLTILNLRKIAMALEIDICDIFNFKEKN